MRRGKRRPPNPDILSGGRAQGQPDEAFDGFELARGTLHEREHTDNPAIAREIAKDHLAEDPRYYSELDRFERLRRLRRRRAKAAKKKRVSSSQARKRRVRNYR